MCAHSILLDFLMDPTRFADDNQRNVIFKTIFGELENVFPQLKTVYEMATEDGYLYVLAHNNVLIITLRFFNQGVITINVEFYQDEGQEPKLNYTSSKQLENSLTKKLNVLSRHVLPPIKRGDLPRYFPSADERLLEYDIDKLVFEQQSEFQKIQIVHSKTLGNMLVLDELQNIAESDLIYTETLMQRGIENYKDKEICILGGGDGALLYELLKEEPKFVTMLEIDEIVMQACNKHLRSICGDVLEKRKGANYEIVVADCMAYMKKYVKEGKKFDYVFGDLTDVPISDTPTGEIWDFIRTILEHSLKLLKPDGKYLTHANGATCPEALQMFEEQLKLLTPPVKFTKATAFVPSFMEHWVFYQVSLA
ncbi:unnamed protein product [Hermetia illucens]|uniref:PABS domain-containing protein n=1 Tax=Hermetia illucens TaxID=343691 RepID=A0A7R8YTU8_HERIL|nr:spermine synthase isoform X2 [Hermetia illucens]CAD7082079.1 unnamed protein product [Hermetia illucens]